MRIMNKYSVSGVHYSKKYAAFILFFIFANAPRYLWSVYVKASDLEGAEKFFRRLRQDGFMPNVVTSGTLMKE